MFYAVHCWEPFIKEEDLMLWKMEEKNHPDSGLYCYKSTKCIIIQFIFSLPSIQLYP